MHLCQLKYNIVIVLPPVGVQVHRRSDYLHRSEELQRRDVLGLRLQLVDLRSLRWAQTRTSHLPGVEVRSGLPDWSPMSRTSAQPRAEVELLIGDLLIVG